MFGALKRSFRSMASLIRNVVGELRPKRTLAASRGFLAAARLSCNYCAIELYMFETVCHRMQSTFRLLAVLNDLSNVYLYHIL